MTTPLDAAAPRIADRAPPPPPQADRRPVRARAADRSTEESSDSGGDSATARAAERAAQRAARLAARRQEAATGDRAKAPPPAAETAREQDAAPPPAPVPTIFDLLRKMPPLPRPKLPKLRVPRLRLLPALVFAALIMLGVRVGDIWEGMTAGPATLAMVEPPPALAADDPAAGESAEDDSPATGEPAEAASGENAATEQAYAEAGRPSLVSDDMPNGELDLVEALAARRDALEAREQVLTQREALLMVAEQRIEEKMEELTALRVQLEGLMGMVDEEQEQHLVSLVNIYETMRPTDAAAIFNGLDMGVLIDVLQRMREQKSAPILAAMEPERARMVTSELVMRRDLPELPE